MTLSNAALSFGWKINKAEETRYRERPTLFYCLMPIYVELIFDKVKKLHSLLNERYISGKNCLQFSRLDNSD